MNALEANGALDIKVIDLEGKSTLCSAMIFCTGLSGRHMRVMY
jgi:ribosomal silencing factor RsfS